MACLRRALLGGADLAGAAVGRGRRQPVGVAGRCSAVVDQAPGTAVDATTASNGPGQLELAAVAVEHVDPARAWRTRDKRLEPLERVQRIAAQEVSARSTERRLAAMLVTPVRLKLSVLGKSR